MKKDELRILQVGNVLVSPDIITEKFCCDLDACKGECCIEGDAGAPVTLDEIMEIEDALDVVWDDLSASAQAIIDKQGVAYTDIEAERSSQTTSSASSISIISSKVTGAPASPSMQHSPRSEERR